MPVSERRGRTEWKGISHIPSFTSHRRSGSQPANPAERDKLSREARGRSPGDARVPGARCSKPTSHQSHPLRSLHEATVAADAIDARHAPRT